MFGLGLAKANVVKPKYQPLPNQTIYEKKRVKCEVPSATTLQKKKKKKKKRLVKITMYLGFEFIIK